MGLSKETRIKIFIAVDVIFFLIEIVIGYVSHSLALVADSFHMLNDVISLCVGLWAVRKATRNPSNEYTYGWARAEVIGGLVNGVFLVALCVSIVLDAIQRFFEPQKVSNPMLVLIVGAVGLAFNILGLFIFGHGHDHDHEEKAADQRNSPHEHGNDLNQAENGHSASYGSTEQTLVAKTDGTSESKASESKDRSVKISRDQVRPSSQKVTWYDDASSFRPSADLPRRRSSTTTSRRSGGRRSSTRSRHGVTDGAIHPATVRSNIQALANRADSDTEEDDESQEHASGDTEIAENASGEASEVTALLKVNSPGGRNISHSNHNHERSQGQRHGHHEHDSNIRGIFLHVLGDALGNVGVMASALIIWLTPWPFRFYFDPIISLLITLIILRSALPLCFDTSRHLLQAVPSHVSIDAIKDDINTLPGVRNCHHIHVWALTPSKIIATLDVELEYDFGTDGQAKYTVLAKEIKHCLRGHGINSSTIQPEFVSPETVALTNGNTVCEDAATKQCCGPTV